MEGADREVGAIHSPGRCNNDPARPIKSARETRLNDGMATGPPLRAGTVPQPGSMGDKTVAIELDVKITSPLSAEDRNLLTGTSIMVLAIANRPLAEKSFPEVFPPDEYEPGGGPAVFRCQPRERVGDLH
jgi:hypothetical protein